jgi:hypothetical protein
LPRVGRGRCQLSKWIALAEVILANLAWIEELDVEGWVVATALAVAAGAALWYFVGTTWLLVAASLYLGLLIVVKMLANRGRR